MTTVIIRKGESFEDALKRFKRKCAQEGIFRELKRRQYYLNDRTKKFFKERKKKSSL